jgi:two-component system chemotaxis response regulator CheY
MPVYIHDRFRTLIVEDDPVSRRFLEEYLDDVSECSSVDTGAAAIASFEAAFTDAPFDLVCLDVFLPDFSGREVLRKMRAIEQANNVSTDSTTAILMTTSAGGIKDVLKAMNLGCDGYVTKPYTKEQLFTELNRLGFGLKWE